MNRVKKLLARPAAPYAALLAALLCLHAVWPVNLGDDPMYQSILQGYSLWNFSVLHYYTWSARTLVEAVLCTVEALPPLVWRLADPALAALAAFCLTRLCGLERRAGAGWFAAGLVLCYDWLAMSTAGWMCTTLVFVWPLAAALLAVQPLVCLRRGRRPALWMQAGAVLLALYAANMEQLLVLLLAGLLGYAGYEWFAKRRPPALTWWLVGACLANLVYIATCPGNTARFETECTSWFIDFGMRSFLQNAELGVSTAMASVVYSYDLLFFVFCVCLGVCVWVRCRAWPLRALGLFPAAVTLVLGVLGAPLKTLVPPLSFFANVVTKNGILNVETVWMPKRYLSFLLLCAVLAACVLDLYLALGHTGAAFAGILAFCAGFATKAMLGFSPTVWQSGARTGFFFAFACIFCALLCWRSLEPEQKRPRRLLAALCAICAALNAVPLLFV